MTIAEARRIDSAIVLVLMGEGDEQVGFHSGVGPLTISGITYTGAGDLLVLDEIPNREGLEATSFKVGLSRSTPEMQREALRADLRDRPVRVSLLLRTGAGLLTQQTVRLKQGRVSSVAITAGAIEVEVHTPMTDLTRVSVAATRLTKEHQREFVDADDSCCDFISEDSVKELIWP